MDIAFIASQIEMQGFVSQLSNIIVEHSVVVMFSNFTKNSGY
jgi:hypothetical protein